MSSSRTILDIVDRSWVVIVDPEPAGLRMAALLRDRNRRVTLVESAREAQQLLDEAESKPAIGILELRVREGLSLRFLPSFRQCSPCTRFLVVTAYGSIAGAVQAIRLGAEDFRCKPLSPDILLRIMDEPGAAGEASRLIHPSLDRAVWEHIQLALYEEGTVAGAARRLGVQPRSLRRMLQKMPPIR